MMSVCFEVIIELAKAYNITLWARNYQRKQPSKKRTCLLRKRKRNRLVLIARSRRRGVGVVRITPCLC
jgi:hypothetical protein